MSEIAIRVTDLVKEYEVYNKPLDLALEVLTRRSRHSIFRALDGVSFDVQRGEVLGIIGSNGAGKSTLLKIITGVLDASAGSVEIAGRVTAILELGLGFNPEYSGYENIYLSSLLYGMNRAEVDEKVEAIIEFSGLREFIDRPVKTYSSGMHARLAFSIATAVDPDILIIDEALAAGDASFVQKCLRRIRQLCSGGRTVLLVSHGTGLLAQLCNRVVWMERGRVRMVGSAIQVVQAYDLASHQSADAASWIETVKDDLDGASVEAAPAVGGDGDAAHQSLSFEPGAGGGRGGADDAPASAAKNVPSPTGKDFRGLFEQGSEAGRQVFRRGPVFIEKVEMLDSAGGATTRLRLLSPFTLRIHYHVVGELPISSLGVAVAINNKYDLAPVAQFMTQNIRPFETRESYAEAPDRLPPAKSGILTLDFDYVPFRKGEYILSLGLLPNEPATWEFYEYRHLYYSFSVDDAGMDVGAPIFLNPTLRHDDFRNDGAVNDVEPEDGETSPASFGELTTLRGEVEAICRREGGYPQRWPRHNACPACGRGPLVFAFKKYGFAHDRCGTCAFICVNPYPPDAVLTKLYSGQYYTQTRELFERPLLEKGGEGTPHSAPKEVLEALVANVTKDQDRGAWLDVGGGAGAFANLIRTLKPNWNVKLNEFNSRSIAIARELFDIKVVTGDPAELARQGERFDVVSSVAVLEHIPEPFQFLKSYAALVKPGGWLVTVMPHFSRLNGFVSGAASPNAVPPYHVSLFNEFSLRQLLSRLDGFEAASIEQAGSAAFRLIDHVNFGDHWDIEIPTLEHPSPRSFLRTPYDDQMGSVLNVLADADGKIGDYFAETDGRVYIVACCRKAA